MQYDFLSPTITKNREKLRVYIVYMVASKSTTDRNKYTVLLSIWYLYFCQFISMYMFLPVVLLQNMYNRSISFKVLF